MLGLLKLGFAGLKVLQLINDLKGAGFEPEGNSSADFTAYIKAEIAKWKKVIADAKIKQI